MSIALVVSISCVVMVGVIILSYQRVNMLTDQLNSTTTSLRIECAEHKRTQRSLEEVRLELENSLMMNYEQIRDANRQAFVLEMLLAEIDKSA